MDKPLCTMPQQEDIWRLYSTWSPQVLTWIWSTGYVESWYILSVVNILLVVYRVSRLAFMFCEGERRCVRLLKNSSSTQGKDKRSSLINYNQTHRLSTFSTAKKRYYIDQIFQPPKKSRDPAPYSILTLNPLIKCSIPSKSRDPPLTLSLL